MKKAPIPENEKQRLAALKQLSVLDSAPEQIFDEITRMAALVCDTKVALLTLIDADRQWFKSRVGVAATETPRDISFCGHAILGPDLLEISDAKLNPDFCDNPLVLGEPNIRFYAGAPLTTREGFRLGTLCVIDPQARKLTAHQKQILESLAKQAVGILELRVADQEKDRIKQDLERAQAIAKVGSWSFNLATKELRWSTEHYKIFEVSQSEPQDTLYERYLERVHPADVPKLDRHFENASKDGQGFVFDHRVYLDEGSRIKYVQVIAELVKGSDGKPVSLVGTCRDLTETIETEAKFKTIVNSMHDGLIVQDAQGAVTEFNASALSILRLSEKELLGRTSIDTIWQRKKPNGEDFSAEERPALVALKTGRVQKDVQMIVTDKEGKVTWINITSVPLFKDGTGTPYAVVSTFSDITQTHQAVREFQRAMEFITVGFYRADAEGRCTFVNEKWCELTGLNSAQAHGEGWFQAIHPEDRDKVFTEWKNSVEEDRSFMLDFRFLRPDGKSVFIQAHAEKIKDPAGAITGYIGSIHETAK